MIKFVELPGCYQQKMAMYFGQKNQSPCRECSFCQHQKLPQLKKYQTKFEQLQQFFLSKMTQKEDKYDFSEKTLLNLCLHQPKNREECLKIAGIGPGWLKKWYQIFIQFQLSN